MQNANLPHDDLSAATRHSTGTFLFRLRPTEYWQPHRPAPHCGTGYSNAFLARGWLPKTNVCDKIQDIFTEEQEHQRTIFHEPTRPGWATLFGDRVVISKQHQ